MKILKIWQKSRDQGISGVKIKTCASSIKTLSRNFDCLQSLIYCNTGQELIIFNTNFINQEWKKSILTNFGHFVTTIWSKTISSKCKILHLWIILKIFLTSSYAKPWKTTKKWTGPSNFLFQGQEIWWTSSLFCCFPSFWVILPYMQIYLLFLLLWIN